MDNDTQLIKEYAIKAGAIAMNYFGKNPKISWKDEKSPVSQADTEIDAFLQKNLLQARPEYGWLSEEIKDNEARLEKNKIFIVDPIDGTRGFINGENDWCVSIAVIENHQPVAGVLHSPVLQQTFLATKNAGAWFFEKNEMGKKLLCEKNIGEKILKVSSPQSFFDILQKTNISQMEKMPTVISLAWRLACVANGAVDLVMVKENSCEWDIAAADIILREAGAGIYTLAGDILRYNEKNIRQEIIFACNMAYKETMKQMAKHI